MDGTESCGAAVRRRQPTPPQPQPKQQPKQQPQQPQQQQWRRLQWQQHTRARWGRRLQLQLLVTLALALVLSSTPRLVRADEEECEEECEPEFVVTICTYRDDACADEDSAVCIERTEENSGAAACSCESIPPEMNEDETEIIDPGFDCEHEFNTVKRFDDPISATTNVSPFGQSEGFLMMYCNKGELPPNDETAPTNRPVGTMTINFFKFSDCSEKLCVHEPDRDHDLCKACRDEETREIDLECGCGLCTAGYPAGWENGKCEQLTDHPEFLSAKVEWVGEPCKNAIFFTGIVVLLSICVPTFLVFVLLFVKWLIRTEKLCWKPGGTCCGRPCGRKLYKAEQKAWASKYEQKQEAKQQQEANANRWQQFKANEGMKDEKHQAFRRTLNANNNKLKENEPPAPAPKLGASGSRSRGRGGSKVMPTEGESGSRPKSRAQKGAESGGERSRAGDRSGGGREAESRQKSRGSARSKTGGSRAGSRSGRKP